VQRQPAYQILKEAVPSLLREPAADRADGRNPSADPTGPRRTDESRGEAGARAQLPLLGRRRGGIPGSIHLAIGADVA